MNDPIERADAITGIKGLYNVLGAAGTKAAVMVLENIPAAAATNDRPHGRWIFPTVIGGRAFHIPHCSACGGVPCGVDKNTKFCPHCGDPKEAQDNGTNDQPDAGDI